MEIDGGSECYGGMVLGGHVGMMAWAVAGSPKFLATQARQGWPPHFVERLSANQPALDAAKRILG